MSMLSTSSEAMLGDADCQKPDDRRGGPRSLVVRIHRLLEYGSLDAPLVALVWGCAITLEAGRSLHFAEMAILFLATWLAYVADRLWECRPGREVPETPRHRHYARNHRPWLLIWVTVLPLAIGLAWLTLPGWKFLGGWAVTLMVFAYFGSLGMRMPDHRRLILKRVAVPLLFAAGTALMAEGWHTTGGRVATAVLAAAAAANVLLISMQESRPHYQPPWLPQLAGISLLINFLVSQTGLLLDVPASASGLAHAIIGFVLIIRIQAAGVPWIRAFTDGSLLFCGLLLVVLA